MNSAVTCIVFVKLSLSFLPIFSEVLYEDEAFKQRQLSALLASKVSTCKSLKLIAVYYVPLGKVYSNLLNAIQLMCPLNRKLSMVCRKAFKDAE